MDGLLENLWILDFFFKKSIKNSPKIDLNISEYVEFDGESFFKSKIPYI